MITLEYGRSIIRLINTITIKLKEVLVSLVNIIPYEYVTMVILPRETMTITQLYCLFLVLAFTQAVTISIKARMDKHEYMNIYSAFILGHFITPLNLPYFKNLYKKLVIATLRATKKRELIMLFWPIFGNFWCRVVTLVTFSSNISNLKRNK